MYPYMSARILHLIPKAEPIGHFIRIGSSGHHQLETLHSSGRLPVNRVVAEAASFKAQSELLGLLRNAGAEITLDTRIAELSEAGSYVSSAQWLASADKSRPMIPRDFAGDGCRRIAPEVATFAVTHTVNAVLAPSQPMVADRSAAMHRPEAGLGRDGWRRDRHRLFFDDCL